MNSDVRLRGWDTRRGRQRGTYSSHPCPSSLFLGSRALCGPSIACRKTLRAQPVSSSNLSTESGLTVRIRLPRLNHRVRHGGPIRAQNTSSHKQIIALPLRRNGLARIDCVLNQQLPSPDQFNEAY